MKGFVGIFAIFVGCVGFARSSEESQTAANSALIPCKRVGFDELNSRENSSYKWSCDACKSIDSSVMKDRTSVTRNGALLINRFTKEDHGKYKCRVMKGNTQIEEVDVDVDDKYRLSTEYCHPASCIAANKCGNPNGIHSCPDEGEVCCRVVRNEDRHRCRHFLGECMKSCNPKIQRNEADDCPQGTECCVLV